MHRWYPKRSTPEHCHSSANPYGVHLYIKCKATGGRLCATQGLQKQAGHWIAVVHFYIHGLRLRATVLACSLELACAANQGALYIPIVVPSFLKWRYRLIRGRHIPAGAWFHSTGIFFKMVESEIRKNQLLLISSPILDFGITLNFKFSFQISSSTHLNFKTTLNVHSQPP